MSLEWVYPGFSVDPTEAMSIDAKSRSLQCQFFIGGQPLWSSALGAGAMAPAGSGARRRGRSGTQSPNGDEGGGGRCVWNRNSDVQPSAEWM